MTAPNLKKKEIVRDKKWTVFLFARRSMETFYGAFVCVCPWRGTNFYDLSDGVGEHCHAGQGPAPSRRPDTMERCGRYMDFQPQDQEKSRTYSRARIPPPTVSTATPLERILPPVATPPALVLPVNLRIDRASEG
jgi:hypothetical protein